MTSMSPAPPLRSLDELRREMQRATGGFGDAQLRRYVPTGVASLDAVLPGGGLPSGALTELLDDGDGAWTLAALAARSAARDGGFVVWVDAAGELYPPALAALGLDLERLVLVRPPTLADALWVFDQAIRCRAAAATVAVLRGLNMALTRRLQLAAEPGEGAAIVVRPSREAAVPSAAAVRLRVRAAPSEESGSEEKYHSAAAAHGDPSMIQIRPEGATRGAWLPPRRIAVDVLRARGASAAACAAWEISDANGAVRCVAPPLERSSEPRRRAASA